MGLIIQKFGGSSVADAERIRNVARIITETYDKGNSVVVVVSAQGGTTDELIAKAAEINPDASRREMDMLLSTGEQASCALCAMAVEVMGYPVISLTGRQAGVHSDSNFGDAKIQWVDVTRLMAELEAGRIVIVAGFQGEDPNGDITTLGRGGSDTSAVALAAALNAQLCQIYTDVDGVYTADPRAVSEAIKREVVTYDEMLELARHGAKVLHDRSVELAKEGAVPLEVLSSFSGNSGTQVKAQKPFDKMEQLAGITEENAVLLLLTGIENTDGIILRVGTLLEREGLVADLAVQAGDQNDAPGVALVIQEKMLGEVIGFLEKYEKEICFTHIATEDSLMRVTIVGMDIGRDRIMSERIQRSIKGTGIASRMISYDKHRISILLEREGAEDLLSLLHHDLFE